MRGHIEIYKAIFIFALGIFLGVYNVKALAATPLPNDYEVECKFEMVTESSSPSRNHYDLAELNSPSTCETNVSDCTPIQKVSYAEANFSECGNICSSSVEYSDTDQSGNPIKRKFMTRYTPGFPDRVLVKAQCRLKNMENYLLEGTLFRNGTTFNPRYIILNNYNEAQYAGFTGDVVTRDATSSLGKDDLEFKFGVDGIVLKVTSTASPSTHPDVYLKVPPSDKDWLKSLKEDYGADLNFFYRQDPNPPKKHHLHPFVPPAISLKILGLTGIPECGSTAANSECYEGFKIIQEHSKEWGVMRNRQQGFEIPNDRYFNLIKTDNFTQDPNWGNEVITLSSFEYNDVALISVRNMGTGNATVNSLKLQFKGIETGTDQFDSDGSGQVSSFTTPTFQVPPLPNYTPICELAFTKATEDPISQSPLVYQIFSGTNLVKPILYGLPGYIAIPRGDQVTYSAVDEGQKNTLGEMVFDADPGPRDAPKIYNISATVDTFIEGDANVSCPEVGLQALGASNAVKITKFSDCELFAALKYYYQYNLDSVGVEALTYPEDSEATLALGEIPFMGIANGAQYNQNAGVNALNINFGAGGELEYPDESQRQFARVYLVGRTVDSSTTGGTSMGPPLLCGEILPYDFEVTELKACSGDMNDISDTAVPGDTMIVFEAIAKRYVPGDYDANVTTGDPRYVVWHGIDFNIPFAYGSCNPAIQLKIPKVPGKDLPEAIKNASLCRYSTPFKMRNFRDSKITLNMMYLTPPDQTFQYPPALMRSADTPKTCEGGTGGDVECWTFLNEMPPTYGEAPLSSHAACLTLKPVQVSAGYRYRCGCNWCTGTVSRIVYQKTLKNSCQVLEMPDPPPPEDENPFEKECKGNLAFRFDGYFMQMIASLGCAVKYEAILKDFTTGNPGEALREAWGIDSLSGVNIAATLPGQGIIPYSTQALVLDAQRIPVNKPCNYSNGCPSLDSNQRGMGGAEPAEYKQYRAPLQADVPGGAFGYDCIPCQFAVDAFRVGVLPLDQNHMTSPRAPIFSFRKEIMPSTCTKETTFEVRYFGSGKCNGVDNPVGHFCSSSNLGPRSCPVSDNPNVAGKFTTRMCAGSQFGTGNVSASWSPIVIDIWGRGIKVSRNSRLAVEFDIDGGGYKRLIDWPLNTFDVAFLVNPAKDGLVHSVKQLFGDNKSKNGFEALKEQFDSNDDGMIDRRDKDFSKLRLWFDRDRDGVSTADEIEKLEDNGVGKIELRYIKHLIRGIEGKTLNSTYYNEASKRFMNISDVYFRSYTTRFGKPVKHRQNLQTTEVKKKEAKKKTNVL